MSIQGIPHPEGLVLVLTLGIFMLLGSFTSILIYSWMIQKLRISNNQIFDLFRLIGKKHAYTYALCVIFMILVSLEMSKYVLWVVVRLPQRLKSTFFELFLQSDGPPFENLKKTLILAFEANSALSPENETKIVKITQCVCILCTFKKYDQVTF